MATCRGIGQESAEAIVGATPSQVMGWLETSPVKRRKPGSLTHRRAEHREGKNLYELS
jgi:hypothetical protein